MLRYTKREQLTNKIIDSSEYGGKRLNNDRHSDRCRVEVCFYPRRTCPFCASCSVQVVVKSSFLLRTMGFNDPKHSTLG